MKANCHCLLHERHVGFHTGQPHRAPNRDQPVFLNFCPIVAGQSPVPRISLPQERGFACLAEGRS